MAQNFGGKLALQSAGWASIPMYMRSSKRSCVDTGISGATNIRVIRWHHTNVPPALLRPGTSTAGLLQGDVDDASHHQRSQPHLGHGFDQRNRAHEFSRSLRVVCCNDCFLVLWPFECKAEQHGNMATALPFARKGQQLLFTLTPRPSQAHRISGGRVQVKRFHGH